MLTLKADGYLLRHTDKLVRPLVKAADPLRDAEDAVAAGNALRALGKVRAALTITRAHRARAATSPELMAAAASPALASLLARHEDRAAEVLRGVAALLARPDAEDAEGQGR